MTSLLFTYEFITFIKAIVQVIIIAYILYRFYEFISNTKAVEMLYLFAVYLVLSATSYVLHLEVLSYLFKLMFIPFIVIVFLIYQNDFKKISSFSILGKKNKNINKIVITAEDVESIVNACKTLASQKRGALFVIPRTSSLEHIKETGVIVDASITTSLLLTIFDHDTPLHDGAVVIEKGRISAAGCFLPLSERQDIRKNLGTRHRAALGVAESYDCVVVIVSEETQKTSVCFADNFYYAVDINDLKNIILSLANFVKRVDYAKKG